MDGWAGAEEALTLYMSQTTTRWPIWPQVSFYSHPPDPGFSRALRLLCDTSRADYLQESISRD